MGPSNTGLSTYQRQVRGSREGLWRHIWDIGLCCWDPSDQFCRHNRTNFVSTTHFFLRDNVQPDQTCVKCTECPVSFFKMINTIDPIRYAFTWFTSALWLKVRSAWKRTPADIMELTSRPGGHSEEDAWEGPGRSRRSSLEEDSADGAGDEPCETTKQYAEVVPPAVVPGADSGEAAGNAVPPICPWDDARRDVRGCPR